MGVGGGVSAALLSVTADDISANTPHSEQGPTYEPSGAGASHFFLPVTTRHDTGVAVDTYAMA